MLKYPHLFSPIKVGNVVFRNRIFASPTGWTDIRSDFTLDDRATLYYSRKAEGGAAAVCVGECQVDPKRSSRGGNCIDLSNPRNLKYMVRIADNISRHGAIASAELSHCGRYGAYGFGPSAGDVDGRPCREMTEEEILETIKAYGNAAFYAKNSGYKMVTVHGGHGWLPEQFFSRTTNQRTDRWGGSLENRARFAVAVCEEIRKRCGRDYPIEFRISAVETEFGYDLDEGIEYAKALDGHADIIHVSAGVHGTLMHDNWVVCAPGMFSDEGNLVKYAAAIKPHLKHSLVGTVGSISDPAMMEEIIASGKADFINMARQLLCDPDLPNKARAGKDEEIRTCIRCMSCWSSLMTGNIFCALNPRISREAELDRPALEHENLKVTVIGGGTAGMQAALTAAECGHQVTLLEKSSVLGGALACEHNVPFKKNLANYMDYMRRHMEKAGVDLRMNTEATPELVASMQPDAVIAAVGAHSTVPKIEGVEQANVFDAREAFAHPEKLGKRVALIGAGLVGCELAIYLKGLGHEVQPIEMTGAISTGGLNTQGTVVKRELRRLDIQVSFNSTVKRFTPAGVEYEKDGELRTYEADSIVYSVGQTPDWEKAMAFADCAPVFQMIGDCTGPANIMSAVRTAFTVARDLGKK